MNNVRTRVLRLGLLFGASALIAGTVQGAAFQNGSFEIASGPSGTLAAGSTFITGWTVGSGTIDYLNNTPWPGTDGPHSIDLDGNSTAGAGSLFQSFDTIAGTAYRVLFDLAGNAGSGPAIKTVRLSAAGTVASFTFDTTGKTFASMGWRLTTFDFVATAATTTLTFQSLVGTGYGPVIDNVRVAAVPEPSAAWMLGGGLFVVATRRIRDHNRAQRKAALT